MFLAYELERVFNKKYERNVRIGAEMEVYVLVNDSDMYFINSNNDLIREIYERMDERVYRDWYEYQLEIRTNPSDDPVEVANELIDLFEEADKIAKGMGCKLVPISYLKGSMFNGLHVHVSYIPRISEKEMIWRIIAAYPFIVDVARLSLSSPVVDEEVGKVLSKRIVSEVHVATPPVNLKVDELIDMWFYDNDNRYYDIIVNNNRREGRHRIKDVDTIEIRIFDVIGCKGALRDVMKLTYYIMSSINFEWIKEFRKQREFRVSLFKVYKAIRENMAKTSEYINPFTGTYPSLLMRYFENKICPDEPWVYLLWWDWKEFCTVQYQSKVRYMLE